MDLCASPTDSNSPLEVAPAHTLSPIEDEDGPSKLADALREAQLHATTSQLDRDAAIPTSSVRGERPPPSQSTPPPSTVPPPPRIHSRPTPSTSHETRFTQSSSTSSHGSSSRSQRTRSYEYKETLDAKTKDLDDGSRIINQYRLCGVIGRGAYGVVHHACLVSDPTAVFAVKEFGKTRLRKTHRAANLRRPLARRKQGSGVGGMPVPNGGLPGPARGQWGMTEGDSGVAGIPPGRAGRADPEFAKGDGEAQAAGAHPPDANDPLSLIRHEIAILKKLDHPHVVQLYEVLDDPSRDGLYMVFEYCGDGPVIDIKLHERVQPLDEAQAREYLTQIVLGVEYLHCSDIVHRDIKPDNILLKENRTVCKIVDFGVSEMFVKPGDDTLKKSAGSPAFMSPELCTAGHGDFHGKRDDIWSLGVTFYCMVVGHLPFDKSHFLDLYESIKNDEPEYPAHLSPPCVDLLRRFLDKDPAKRITIAEIRNHPWLLEGGNEALVSRETNTERMVLQVTDEELDRAICRIASVFTVARAIQRFKKGSSQGRGRGASHRSAGSNASDADASDVSAPGVGVLGADIPRTMSPAVAEERGVVQVDACRDDGAAKDHDARRTSTSLAPIAVPPTIPGTSRQRPYGRHDGRAVPAANGSTSSQAHFDDDVEDGGGENGGAAAICTSPSGSEDESRAAAPAVAGEVEPVLRPGARRAIKAEEVGVAAETMHDLSRHISEIRRAAQAEGAAKVEAAAAAAAAEGNASDVDVETPVARLVPPHGFGATNGAGGVGRRGFDGDGAQGQTAPRVPPSDGTLRPPRPPPPAPPPQAAGATAAAPAPAPPRPPRSPLRRGGSKLTPDAAEAEGRTVGGGDDGGGCDGDRTRREPPARVLEGPISQTPKHEELPTPKGAANSYRLHPQPPSPNA